MIPPFHALEHQEAACAVSQSQRQPTSDEIGSSRGNTMQRLPQTAWKRPVSCCFGALGSFWDRPACPVPRHSSTCVSCSKLAGQPVQQPRILWGLTAVVPQPARRLQQWAGQDISRDTGARTAAALATEASRSTSQFLHVTLVQQVLCRALHKATMPCFHFDPLLGKHSNEYQSFAAATLGCHVTILTMCCASYAADQDLRCS